MAAISELGVKYGDRVVFENFSLEISPHTTVCVMGRSGCGKSTLLNCVAGLIPHTGRTEGFGACGYVFQDSRLIPSMTVLSNVAYVLNGEKEDVKRRAQKALEEMGIGHLAHKYPTRISGGEASRVSLARALAYGAQTLLLDEPFSALDSYLREQLQIQVKDILTGYGKDVLLVSHSRDEVYYLCGRTAVMNKGKILKTDETKKLFADPGSRAGAELTGCKNIAKARKIGEYQVEVPDWGICLRTGKPVREDVCAVGLRAHYFNPKARENIFPVVYSSEREEPFEMRILFRYEGQKEGTPDLWWRIPKDRNPRILPEKLGIAPQNILLLYPEQTQEDEI